MVDRATARFHGVCPECEGYGGRWPDPCEDSATCEGSCPKCWCPGCHDGHVDIPPPPSGELTGSWEAYAALQEAGGEDMGQQEGVK